MDRAIFFLGRSSFERRFLICLPWVFIIVYIVDFKFPIAMFIGAAFMFIGIQELGSSETETVSVRKRFIDETVTLRQFITKLYGKSQIVIGKLTKKNAIVNGYVEIPEGRSLYG